jgi:cyanophycinase
MTDSLIALVGSGEYLQGMESIDRRLLAASPAGVSRRPKVVCLPTASAREGPAVVERWATMGLAHFGRLEAEVACAYVLDRDSASDPKWAALIEAADLIYFSGGDPLHLYETLMGSRAWEAVEAARRRGAVYAGCSAGAMIVGGYVPDVRSAGLALHPAFGLLAGSIILPHFDLLESFRPGATEYARGRLSSGEYLIGVDENTALVGHAGGDWQVMGVGKVWLIDRQAKMDFAAGAGLRLP